MAIVTIPGGLWLPSVPGFAPAAPVPSALNLTASGHRGAAIFEAPKTGTLEGVGWVNGVNGTTSFTLRVSFQDVAGDGFPDGTPDETYAVGVPTSNVWNNSGTIATAGVKRAVTRGQRLAVVWDFSAYTAGTTAIGVWSVTNAGGFPYAASYNGTTWTRSANVPTLALKYDDGTYESLGPLGSVMPAATFPSTAFHSGSTPDERGLRVTLPVTARLSGIWALANLTAAADFDVVVYEGTTQLVRDSIDGDHHAVGSVRYFFHVLTAAQTLTAGTVYRVTLAPATGTSITVYHATFNLAAIRGAWDGGTGMALTTRSDLGAFTDTDTAIPLLGLYLDGLDVGGGGGSEAGTGSRLNRGIN